MESRQTGVPLPIYPRLEIHYHTRRGTRWADGRLGEQQVRARDPYARGEAGGGRPHACLCTEQQRGRA